MIRVLIVGGSGLLGHKLFQQLSTTFHTYATFRERHNPGAHHPIYASVPAVQRIGGVDAYQLEGVVRAVAQVQPDVVINCVGIVKQLAEATDPIACLTVNALFPHRLADVCAASGARLIHISTDCVFSGRQGGYRESDITDAEDLYGRSKLLGEVDRGQALTLRTSIIGRDVQRRYGLLEWFFSQQGQQITGYTNVIYSGLTTLALAQVIRRVIVEHSHLEGLYQVASQPISKYDLLFAIREAFQLDIEIQPSAEPHSDRSMSAARFMAATGDVIPTWDTMIADLAADPTPYDLWRKQYATV